MHWSDLQKLLMEDGMLKVLVAVVVAAFATVSISAPADAARSRKSVNRSVTVNSQPVTYSSQIRVGSPTRAVYRSASANVSRSSVVPGIRDRSVHPFAHSVDGHAFFDDLTTRSSF